jgi:HEAT repeat protein
VNSHHEFICSPERRTVGLALARCRSMTLSIVITLVFSGHVFSDPIEKLLSDVSRYASKPEKRANKENARLELKSRMSDTLRAAMKYMHGDNVGLQVQITEWLIDQPTEIVTPVLLDFVDDEKSETRRLALYFLGFHQTPEHAERVMKYLDDEDCRGAALRTLGKWKVIAAREPAEKWLAEGRERVRVVAANALRDIGDPRAIPALTEALNDPVFTVRNTAARALISFGEPAAAYLKSADTTALLERTAAMRKRCLSDLKAIHAQEAIGDDGIVLEGNFFLP